MKDRKMITERIVYDTYALLGCCDDQVFNGTIIEVLEKIHKIEKYAEDLGFLPHTVKFDHFSYDYDECSFEIKASRYETEKEQEKRIEAAEKRKKREIAKKAKRKAKDLAELKRLKEIYEN